MSYGKPSVCTDVGSLSEVMIDGKTGILIPPKDSQALASAIIHLLENDDLRRRMGKNALNHSNSKLSWVKISELTTDSYNMILNG